MTAYEVAQDHRADRRRLVAQAVAAVAAWWARLDRDDLDGSWYGLVRPGLVRLLTESQRRAASTTDSYLDRLDAEWAALFGTLDHRVSVSDPRPRRVEPAGFAGVAVDQRPLDTLLDNSIVRTKVVLAAGFPMRDSLDAGRAVASRAVVSETVDAGRLADGAGLVSRTAYVGYYRALVLPSCARCVILAGRWYRALDGFRRHPRCDCVHLPTPVARPRAEQTGIPTLDPMAAVRASQVRGLSKGDLQALEDGADLARIVNLRRGGVRTATGGPNQRARRPTPEVIYRRAGGDRAQAVRLLERWGYIVPTSTPVERAA